jgi:hypothetical protein
MRGLGRRDFVPVVLLVIVIDRFIKLFAKVRDMTLLRQLAYKELVAYILLYIDDSSFYGTGK